MHLTGKEYQMLELLSLRKGTTLTKEMFLNHLYGGMDEPELKIIDVFICKLRKKLATAAGGKNFIETVWGRGYVLRERRRTRRRRHPRKRLIIQELRRGWARARALRMHGPVSAAPRAALRPDEDIGPIHRHRQGKPAAAASRLV